MNITKYDEWMKKMNYHPSLKDIMIDRSRDWNWQIISRYSDLTLSFVEDNLDKNWNWGWYGLSKHKDLTMNFVDTYINQRWNWITLSMRLKMDISFLERHKDKIFWNYLSTNPNLIMEICEHFSHEFYVMGDWHYLITKDFMTLGFIQRVKRMYNIYPQNLNSINIEIYNRFGCDGSSICDDMYIRECKCHKSMMALFDQ